MAFVPGFDWPGRAATLAASMEGASPERRREILLEAASARDPSARGLVLGALDDSSPSVRFEAAALAARLGFSEATPHLIGWLDHPEPTYRLAATRALGALRVPEAFPALRRVLADADVGVRLAAVEAVFAVAGRDATVALLDRLSDPESEVRLAAVRALGELADVRAVLPLLGTLQDAIPEVRAAGAHALGAIGDVRALRALVTAFHDAVPDVREAAVRAVGTLRSPLAVADLAAIALRESREGAPAAWSRLAVIAVQSLGHIATPTATDVLVEVVRRAGEFVDREPPRAALRVLTTLGEMARARIPALAQSTPADLESDLFTALGALGGDEAAQAILRRLERPTLTPSLRSQALVSLGETGSRVALLPLLARAASPANVSPPRTSFGVGACASPRLDQGALDGLTAYVDRNGSLEPESFDLLLAMRERAQGGCEQQMAAVLLLLGRTGNPRAALALAPSLRAVSVSLRLAAARALAAAPLAGAERALLDALGDPSPDVRSAAADALARGTTPEFFPFLLDRWDGSSPVDRVALARVIGRTIHRVGERSLHQRASTTLTACVQRASPELAGACLDALADLAAQGDLRALETLEAAARGDRRSLRAVAAEALGNAVTMASGTLRTSLGERAIAVARDPAQRAVVAWVLGEGAEVTHVLREALGDTDPAVVANAMASLGRLAARGIAVDLGDTLCRVLRAWRHPVVLANGLRALAHIRAASCADAIVPRALGSHPEVLVREAALAAALARMDDGIYRAAVSRCAAFERSPTIAAMCRRARMPPNDERTASIDAQVIDAAGEPLEGVSLALLLPDHWVRMGVSGPGGWVHVRPTPQGRFVVLAPSDLMFAWDQTVP